LHFVAADRVPPIFAVVSALPLLMSLAHARAWR
jgi:hypothetical protein